MYDQKDCAVARAQESSTHKDSAQQHGSTSCMLSYEPQDTLKAQPSGSSEKAQMRRAISSSWVVFTSLYMCVGCLGYSAFGDKTPINLLTKSGTYGFYNPYWLIDCGNIFVMIRMVGAYQVS